MMKVDIDSNKQTSKQSLCLPVLSIDAEYSSCPAFDYIQKQRFSYLLERVQRRIQNSLLIRVLMGFLIAFPLDL